MQGQVLLCPLFGLLSQQHLLGRDPLPAMSGFAEGLKHHVLQLQFLLLFNIYLLLLFIVCATADASINKGDFGITFRVRVRIFIFDFIFILF